MTKINLKNTEEKQLMEEGNNVAPLTNEDKIIINSENNKKLLTIDPSGTGTTGTCLIDKEGNIEFDQFTSKEWDEHLDWLIEKVKAKKPDLIVLLSHLAHIHLLI